MEKRLLGALTSCVYTMVGFERQYDQAYLRQNVTHPWNCT